VSSANISLLANVVTLSVGGTYAIWFSAAPTGSSGQITLYENNAPLAAAKYSAGGGGTATGMVIITTSGTTTLVLVNTSGSTINLVDGSVVNVSILIEKLQ
jgi:hypothetical protein